MATRAEREQEEREREEAEQRKQRGHATGQTNQQNQQDPVNAEQQRQATEQAKQQKAYIDEMNRKIGEVVNTAAGAKDKDPQLLSFTVQALKNAAQQLEAAQPPNVPVS